MVGERNFLFSLTSYAELHIISSNYAYCCILGLKLFTSYNEQ